MFRYKWICLKIWVFIWFKVFLGGERKWRKFFLDVGLNKNLLIWFLRIFIWILLGFKFFGVFLSFVKYNGRWFLIRIFFLAVFFIFIKINISSEMINRFKLFLDFFFFRKKGNICFDLYYILFFEFDCSYDFFVFV